MSRMDLIVGIAASFTLIALAICGTLLAFKDAINFCHRRIKQKRRSLGIRPYALSQIIVRINTQIRGAEALTVDKCDDDTLKRASKVLADLREQRLLVEVKLRGQ